MTFKFERLPKAPYGMYQKTELRNMVVSPMGAIYRRPRSKWKLAWLVLRGYEVYGK